MGGWIKRWSGEEAGDIGLRGDLGGRFIYHS